MRIHTSIVPIFWPVAFTKKISAENYFPLCSPNGPPHKNFSWSKNVSPYKIHFLTPKEKFYLKYLFSYSEKCEFRKFPPTRGEISPRGSMSPNMQVLYVCSYTPYFDSCTVLDMDFRKCRHFEISPHSWGNFPMGFQTPLNTAHLAKEHACKNPIKLL